MERGIDYRVGGIVELEVRAVLTMSEPSSFLVEQSLYWEQYIKVPAEKVIFGGALKDKIASASLFT